MWTACPTTSTRSAAFSSGSRPGGPCAPATRPPAPATCSSAPLTQWGVECHLAAPSLIPRRPGEHRKTDRRDAIKIARDFRDDRLVLIHITTELDERIRDLVRCRETFQREIVKSRHYILKFMRRRGFVFREANNWTVRHFNWIRQVLTPGILAEEDHTVLSEYLALLEYKLQRRDQLDRRIEALALTPRYKPVVDRLCCFRGFKTQAAMVIATELGDPRRFENPRQLMAYVGLVPSEQSPGDRRRLGAITKAGNSRVRHTLTQASWQYRKRPAAGAPLQRRQQGQDPAVIRHAWKCQHRLYTLFHRLAVKKPGQVAVRQPPELIREIGESRGTIGERPKTLRGPASAQPACIDSG